MKTPIDSLHEIFLLWHPRTSASFEERLRVLDSVRDRYPRTGWSLLLGLLPKSHDLSVGTVQPRWHSWAPQDELVVSYSELSDAAIRVSDRLLADVGRRIDRWTELIRAADDLPRPGFQRLLEELSQLDKSTIDEPDLVAFREALRDLINRHWEHPDAKWALPDEYVSQLFDAYERFQPTDPVLRNSWLFTPWPKLPARRSGERSYEVDQKVAGEWRIAALREVLDESGLDAFWALADAADSPWLVGFSLARTGRKVTRDVLAAALSSEYDRARQVALGILSGIASGQGGVERIHELLASPLWTPEQRGEIYLALPFGPSTWDELRNESPEVVAGYWTSVDPHGRGGDLPAAVVVRAATEYTRWGSPVRALRILALYGIEGQDDLKMAALESLVSNTPTDARTWSDLGHDLIDALGSLESAELDMRRVAAVEWYFLPILSQVQFGYRPAALDNALARDPSFFIELLSTVYRPEGAEERSLSEEEQARAHAAFKLLNNWARLPGLRNEGVDQDDLQDWVTSVLALATDAKLRTIAAVHIGHVLAFSPDGEDGLWPHEAIRNVIEGLASDDVERGFEIQVANNRGVTSRSLGEGGNLERELANRYRSLAQSLVQSWPRTAAALRRIGMSYESDAKRQDERAERIANDLD